jgi:ABC-type nitrate/sulfonate/bicarbonate transport system substrate-binding protein
MKIVKRPGRVGKWSGVAVAAAVAGLVAAGCGSSNDDNGGQAASSGGIKGQRLTMMVQSSAGPSKVVEAHAIELLKQQGVNASIKFNASTPNVAISQLLTSNIDVYAEGVNGGIQGVLQGIPIVDFAVLQPRQDYVFLAHKGIDSLGALKGKKVGVQDTTGANYAQALLVLKQAGLGPKDVSIIAAGGQDTRLPALIAGRVDATMLGHSAEIALKGKGYTTLFDYTKQASTLYDDNAFATRQWLDKHKELAVAFNKALLDSYVWFNDPANASAVVDEAVKLAPGTDRGQTQELFDMLRQAGAYPEGTIIDPKVLDAQQKLFKSVGSIEDTAPVNTWVDTSYAEQAKSQG